jgi:hypothetical protein
MWPTWRGTHSPTGSMPHGVRRFCPEQRQLPFMTDQIAIEVNGTESGYLAAIGAIRALFSTDPPLSPDLHRLQISDAAPPASTEPSTANVSAPFGGWGHLPADLMVKCLRTLRTCDRIAAAGVCRWWRSIVLVWQTCWMNLGQVLMRPTERDVLSRLELEAALDRCSSGMSATGSPCQVEGLFATRCPAADACKRCVVWPRRVDLISAGAEFPSRLTGSLLRSVC